MEFNTLRDVYVHQLKDAYSAEKQLVEALPQMVEAAQAPELKEAFRRHLEETRQHQTAVNQLLRDVNENPGNKHCEAMAGLIKEGEGVITTPGDATVKDAALIAAAQRVEHYEISAYGTLRTYARELGYAAAAVTLQEILDDEYEADQKLDNLAEGSWFSAGLNEKAETA